MTQKPAGGQMLLLLLLFGSCHHKQTTPRVRVTWVGCVCQPRQSITRAQPDPHPRTCAPYTREICSMAVLPPFCFPDARYSSAASTASLPMEILSAPDLRAPGEPRAKAGHISRAARGAHSERVIVSHFAPATDLHMPCWQQRMPSPRRTSSRHDTRT